MFKEHLSYNDALKQAQELGFAETDPTLDVEGFDPKYKLIILALHAFGIIIKPSEILNYGINRISGTEEKLYNETGLSFKLNPVIQKIDKTNFVAFVLPQLINNSNKLFNIHNEYNAVIVEGIFSNEQLFIGKGAGGHPTGSAVLSDISALSYGYKYEYKKYYQQNKINLHNSISIPLYISGNKENLAIFFSEDQITEVHDRGIVLAKRTIQWLINNKCSLDQSNLFIAQIHPDTLTSIKKWKKTYDNLFVSV